MSIRYLVDPDGTILPFQDLVLIEVPDDADTDDILAFARFALDEHLELEGRDEVFPLPGYEFLCAQDSLDDFVDGMLEVHADDAYAAGEVLESVNLPQGSNE